MGLKMLRNIKIICIPCVKCYKAEQVIVQAIRQLEIENKIKYPFSFMKIHDLHQAKPYSANIAQMPFVIFNNNLIMAGHIVDLNAVKMTLTNILKGGMRLY